MWGGRFETSPDGILTRINGSIGFDRRLFAQDIAGSKAHAAMLAACGIIGAEDGVAIQQGLETIEVEIREDRFPFDETLEDIHMNIEGRLADLIGEAAGRLHTARSRNDQVATDFRLYMREAADALNGQCAAFQNTLLTLAESHTETVMPGMTHLQVAQPITFAHHLLAYVEMIARDRSRFNDARRRMNECPLGSAALAGTSYPIDRNMTAEALGFDRPCANSLDAVSDRDFVMEMLACASITAVHLSRLAEEMVLWMSPHFGFIQLSEAHTTGSSIMPQKRNPDAAELVRAKTGRIVGALNTLLVVMKALPLAYSKDMQEDKEPAFDALDSLSLCLAAMTAMTGAMTANRDAMVSAAGQAFATATDLADWLTRVAGLPFRKAHHVAGALVALAEKRNVDLSDLSLDDMCSVEPRITAEVYSVLTPEASVTSRTSYGGTAPDNVRAAISVWRRRLEEEGH